MENEEHFLGKVAQKAIIYQDGRIFLARDPRTPDIWELPGGRLNVDEDPEAGLRRELREELGVECKIGHLIFSKQFRQGAEKQQLSLVLVYEVHLDHQQEISVDSREILEFGWFSKADVLSLKLFPEYKIALDIFFQNH